MSNFLLLIVCRKEKHGDVEPLYGSDFITPSRPLTMFTELMKRSIYPPTSYIAKRV